MAELILAIDVGTTTARAALFTIAGDMAALAKAPLATRSPTPGIMEQDAEAVWRTVRGLISKALRDADREPGDVAAIGVTTQRTSAMIWEKHNGRPVSPLVLWSDLRGTARAAELSAAGGFLAPQQAAAKLESMVAAVEDGPARMSRGELAWGNIDAFVIWKLSGGAVHATDRSQAWPTGYLDLADLDWNEALISGQRLEGLVFPRLVDTFGPLAVTDRAVFGAAVPITSDIADQQSALIAHGGGAGDIKVTYGTSATLDVGTGADLVFRSPAMPPFIVSHVEGRTDFCVEGMVLSAGGALNWLRRVLHLGGHARFEALATSVEDASGVAFLPALLGLGAPRPDPSRTALITGFTPGVGIAHIARAAMEGIAFRVREIVEAMRAAGVTSFAHGVGADGGLSASDAFLQIQADVLGMPIRRHVRREATACGAALGAGRGAGLLGAADSAAFVRFDRTFEPRLSLDEAAGRYESWRGKVHT